jgi:hypothetical protein
VNKIVAILKDTLDDEPLAEAIQSGLKESDTFIWNGLDREE